MNKRAAEQYLDKLFGKRVGHVAVAYKDQDQSWQEHQFSWPTQRAGLLQWAEIHQGANVFICPALRKDPHTRKKGDMLPSRWLWADVDWQGVPKDRVAEVKARINSLGTYVVNSGSGLNAHVYVMLDREVSATDHAKLNTGLRDYLYADNKQADNSLLRLPGTTNWKTPSGSPVKDGGGTGKPVTVDSLRKIRVFRDAKVPVDVDATDWQFSEPEGISGRLRRKVSMPVEQATGIYGSRHDAVYGIVKDLHRGGFDNDQVHTLMHQFPAGLSKMADENGYDLHLDIDRCLARITVIEDEVEEILESDDDMPEVTEDEMIQETINEGVAKELLRRAIRRAADLQEGLLRHREPPADKSESFEDALNAPPEPVQWLIQGMASPEANVILTGQYKAGKTALMIASLIPSLTDGKDFLNKFPVNVPDGGVVVGHWNLEMSRTDLVDKYARKAGIKNPHNLKLAHWRGETMNILTEAGKDAAVKWLSTEPGKDWTTHPDGWVRVWTIDSYAQLARMAGVNTNDNDEVYALMGAIDEIKVRAKVQACFLLGHTGRNSDEKSAASGHLNATRGASAVDEHVDARWVLTKDSTNTRYLATEGRDVEAFGPSALDFDEETKVMTITDRTKADVAVEGYVQTVVAVLATEGEGLNQTNLVKKVQARVKIGQAHCIEAIKDAIEAGFVETKRIEGGRGRPALLHFLTGGKPTGDRARKATPGMVDMSGVHRGRTR